jgi:hypothetical protein
MAKTTSKDRMRALRERAREAQHNDSIRNLSDTALMEALRVAYIKGSTTPCATSLKL